MATTGKSITCQAAVSKALNTPFVIETVEVAPPKAGEVRVKMSFTGLCHSDLSKLEGIDDLCPFPVILGHEGSGIIESVGVGVKSIVPGDVVVLCFESHCGECAQCKNPKTNHCEKQPRNYCQMDGTTRVTCKGEKIYQSASLGAFCEYVVTSEANVTKVTPLAPSSILCLASCCIPTGYGAAVKCAEVSPGSTCAIWGLGGVGMNIVLGCRDSKASKIIGIDINPDKFALAKEFGCTDVLNPKEISKNIPEALMEMTNGGVDYCFVSVGGDISVMEQAFNSSHPLWGETIIVGVTDKGSAINVGVWELLFGRKIKGTWYGSYRAKLEIPQLVDKIVKEQIPMEKLITNVVPLEEINEGYDLLKNRKTIRTVIDFNLKGKVKSHL